MSEVLAGAHMALGYSSKFKATTDFVWRLVIPIVYLGVYNIMILSHNHYEKTQDVQLEEFTVSGGWPPPKAPKVKVI